MIDHLVACFRWHEPGTEAARYLAASDRVSARLAALDARLIAWTTESFSFAVDPTRFTALFRTAGALVREGATHGVGVAQRELMHAHSGRHWGPALAIAEALAAATRPGEMLLDERLSAVVNGDVSAVGSLPVDVLGEHLNPALVAVASDFAPAAKPRRRVPSEADLSHAPHPNAARADWQEQGADGENRESDTGVPTPRLFLEFREPSGASYTAGLSPAESVSKPPLKPPSQPARYSAPPSRAVRRLSQPPPKPRPSTVPDPTAELPRPPPPLPAPASRPGVDRRPPPRVSRIEELGDASAQSLLGLVDRLWYDDHEDLGRFLEGLTRPSSRSMMRASEDLQHALDECGSEDALSRSRITLAYALSLAKGDKPAEALLESLQGLASARRSNDARAERGSELLLAQLARYTGQPELAERWLKIPKLFTRQSG